MIRNKTYLMIFHSDGRAGNLPLDLILMARVVLLVIFVLFAAGAGFILHNLYRLNRTENAYMIAKQNLTKEKADIKSRLVALEEFEQKISFFLSGEFIRAETAGQELNSDYRALGMGGGEEQGVEAILDGGEPSGRQLIDSPVMTPETQDVELRISDLKDRLDQLAALARNKKQSLDYTPSILPTAGYLTSSFGWRKSPFTGRRHFHRGIDLVNRTGTVIKAPAAGRVITVGNKKLWGNTIAIEHRDGIVTRFGHLSGFEVSEGELVRRGDIIGYMGASGRSTGPHLHYQIEIKGRAVDPMHFILEEGN